MAPSAVQVQQITTPEVKTPDLSNLKLHASAPRKEPLKSKGSLDRYESIDVTPIIGTEYTDLNIVDELINGQNADQLLRDLAIKSILYA